MQTNILQNLRDSYLQGKDQLGSEKALALAIEDYIKTPLQHRYEHFLVCKEDSKWIAYVCVDIGENDAAKTKKSFNLGFLELINFDDSSKDPEVRYSNALVQQIVEKRVPFKKIDLEESKSLPLLGLKSLQFLQSYLKAKEAINNARYYGCIENYSEVERIERLMDPTSSQENKIFNIDDFEDLKNKANHWLRYPVAYGVTFTLGSLLVAGAFIAVPVALAEVLGQFGIPLVFIITAAEAFAFWYLAKFLIGKMVAFPQQINSATQALEQMQNLVTVYNEIPLEERKLFVQDAQKINVNKEISASRLPSFGPFWHTVSEPLPDEGPFQAVFPKLGDTSIQR